MMGYDQGNEDESPRHAVSLAGFALDKYEVTQDQFEALELPNPSHFKDPRRPVEQVRWSDAALFCNERSLQDGLEPCYDEITFECNFAASGYRLPTEAEWEYAAKAGEDVDYGFSRSSKSLPSHACYSGNSTKKTDLVGQKRPNRWGIHDMHGNVLEWCHDVYSATYYSQSPPQDPRGPVSGKKRAMRGGAWNSSAHDCLSTARFPEIPGITDACFARDTFGFRCVRRLTPEETERLLQRIPPSP
jgi:formylglycine-generating enzyme required for sulfatase activity